MKSFRVFFITFLILISQVHYVFANILDSWQNPKAYKPKPVLYLHGFGKGSSSDWGLSKSSLSGYFSKYQEVAGGYLETIDFQDPNGSIDRYPAGKFNPQGNSAGWAEKVLEKIEKLLSYDKYGTYSNKLNLVCHSMGGLAARWYLENYSSRSVDKLILIGVPNIGSRWAEIANAASNIPKLGWFDILTVNGFISAARQDLNFTLLALNGIDVYGEAADDLDPSVTGSGFIDNLNALEQNERVSYYGIIGISHSFMNWEISKDYYGGDCIVSKDSQLGKGVILLKDSVVVTSEHWREPEIAAKISDNKILFFLDSDKPELEITSPDPEQTTQVKTTFVQIQGRVYKEYLPADSVLNIIVTRLADGYAMPVQSSLLKPSDLWIPNNSDSPVAEFDERINFPGNGSYVISCQVKNPAGLTSDLKDVLVNVTGFAANIIVHCHNPEGKEIGSIVNVGVRAVEIYDGDVLIGYGTQDAVTHNQSISVSSGTHNIKATFNGLTLNQEFTLSPGEIKILTFIFTREETEITLPTIDHQWTMTGSGHGVFLIQANDSFGGVYAWIDIIRKDAGAEGSMSITVSVNFANYILQRNLLNYSFSPNDVSVSANQIGNSSLSLGTVIVPSPSTGYANWFVQGQLTEGGYISVSARVACAIRRVSNYFNDDIAYPLVGYYTNKLTPGTKNITISNLGNWYGQINLYPNSGLWDAAPRVEYLKADYVSTVPRDMDGQAV